MSACADNTLDDFQTIIVNGTNFTALGSGGAEPPGCGLSQWGNWGANITLNPGTNTVTAQVCDGSGNCGSASTTIIYDAPVYGVTVTRSVASLTLPVNSPGSAYFDVTNTGDVDGQLTLGAACGGVTGCKVVSGTTTGPSITVSLAHGATVTVHVDFTTGSTATTGNATLTASFAASPNTTGSDFTALDIQAPPPTIVVAPDASPRSLGAGMWTLPFEVSNTSGGSEDVAVTVDCGPFTNCVPSARNFSLAPAATDTVWLQFLIVAGQSGTQAAVSLSANGCFADERCATDGGSYTINYTQSSEHDSVSVVPAPASVTLAARATQDTARFTLTNLSTGTGGPISFVLTPGCSGVAGCSGATTTVSLGEQGTYTLKVPYTVSFDGTAGIVSVSAAGGTASASGAESIGTTPSYSVAVIPGVKAQSVALGTNGADTVTIRNTSSNTAASISASLTLSGCTTPVLSDCQVASNGPTIAQGQTSAAIVVSLHAAQAGKGAVTVTASGTVSGGVVQTGTGIDSVTVTTGGGGGGGYHRRPQH